MTVYIHIYIHIYIHTYIEYMCIYTGLYIYIYTYTNMYIYTSIIYIYIYIYIYQWKAYLFSFQFMNKYNFYLNLMTGFVVQGRIYIQYIYIYMKSTLIIFFIYKIGKCTF